MARGVVVHHGLLRLRWVALVAALVIAAAMEALVPQAWVQRAFAAGRGAWTGGALALPSMMCTCCTAPIAASPGAVACRLAPRWPIGSENPALNPAVLVFLAVLLPWPWVTVRVVAGVVLVFVVVPLVARLGAADAGPVEAAPERRQGPASVIGRFARRLGILAVTLVPEYFVVVMAVGAAKPWFSHGTAGPGPLILLPAVLGALFVVPTAGEVPIVLALLAAGAETGPAGALLVTLPALSLPSLVMVGRSFPKRVLVALFAAVVVLGILCGGLLAMLTSRP
ncbi:permease [Amycolatopsis sp. OK19-0408]|uniref:Permease n=1 Tax=Amycolatopsis iheyensis TaxID=2945988 RepID=A0A9X2SQ06_9PSEU|nr:permease [Amycolatopsis iheyensis]MCR6490539.1 permease [Amycolatopsis iheyensis]